MNRNSRVARKTFGPNMDKSGRSLGLHMTTVFCSHSGSCASPKEEADQGQSRPARLCVSQVVSGLHRINAYRGEFEKFKT
jgi:hypothetical protein